MLAVIKKLTGMPSLPFGVEWSNRMAVTVHAMDTTKLALRKRRNIRRVGSVKRSEKVKAATMLRGNI